MFGQEYARPDHSHEAMDVRDVAREHHTHTMHDLGGVPTAQEFARLMDRVSELELQLDVEKAVPDAVAAGNDTIERIAGAIERRAGLMPVRGPQEAVLRAQFRELARAIREIKPAPEDES